MMQTMSVEFQSQQPLAAPPAPPPPPPPASTPGQVSRSSISTMDSESQLHMTSAMTKRWTTLEVAGRLMFLFSVVFLVLGILSTVFGFVDVGLVLASHLPLQIMGPVCLATTGVMWLLGAVFFRLWKMEWRRRQQALELRARVQLHAMAMDILKKPAAAISPRILQDPRLRRQMLMRLRQQTALDVSSVDTTMSRRSSRAASIESRRQRESIVSALLRQELERRRSKELITCEKLLPTFELPGIQISRIETMDFDDGGSSGIAGGSSRGGGGSKRYIIIHSDLPSDFSQLSFTASEHSLSGSRSSKSRSSRASSNVSSRLWDFSPRESEWDADVSLGSRESQLSVSKQDWGGGPSYGACRDYSLLSPSMPRKGSVVTFDMGEPPRRHSSPAPSVRRKSISTDTTPLRPDYPPSALKSSSTGPRFTEEYRTLDQFRKRSAGDQSIISIRIDEDDGDEEEDEEEEEDDETVPLNSKKKEQKNDTEKGTSTGDIQDTDAASVTGCDRRRASLKRNNTDDSEVERRVARIFHEIEYSVTDSVDESKIHSQSSADAATTTAMSSVQRVEAQTQTLTAHELLRALGGDSHDPPAVQTSTTSTGTATTAPSSTETSTTGTWTESTTTDSRVLTGKGGCSRSDAAKGWGGVATTKSEKRKSGGDGGGGRFRLLASLPGAAAFFTGDRRPTTSAGHLGCSSRMEPTTTSASSSASSASAATTAAAVTSSLKSKRLFVQFGFRD